VARVARPVEELARAVRQVGDLPAREEAAAHKAQVLDRAAKRKKPASDLQMP